MNEIKPKRSSGSVQKKNRPGAEAESRSANSSRNSRKNVKVMKTKTTKLCQGSPISRWKRELETEEFARMLAYHGAHILAERKLISSVNGPGWHDPQYPTVIKCATFAQEDRFHDPRGKKSSSVPGPGTYGENHDPYFKIEQKTRAKGFSFSILSSFEQRSKCTRKSSIIGLSKQVPCNLYNLKNSIDELIKKRVSKRGPYDLFTGKRFHEKKALFNTKLYLSKMDPASLNHPKNLFKGTFLRCGMKHQITARLILTDLALCLKNPNDPGPNFYDPYPPRVVRPFKYPFNSTEKHRGPIKSKLLPPPGRYNPMLIQHIPGNGMRSAFLSTTQRNRPTRPKDSWFE